MAFHVEDISLKYAAISPVDSRVIPGPMQHSDVYICIYVYVYVSRIKKSHRGDWKNYEPTPHEISDPRLDPRYLERYLENEARRGGTFRVDRFTPRFLYEEVGFDEDQE